jgi:hypothetical protein
MPISINILLRIVATFVANALAVIGSAAIVGVDLYLAALMGGILAVAKVIEKLSIAFLEDGRLTRSEINAAFRTSVALKGVDEEGNAITLTSKQLKKANTN